MSDAIVTEQAALIGALEFYLDSGVRDFCMDDAEDMYGWANAPSPAFNLSPAKTPLPSAQLRAQSSHPSQAAGDADSAAPLGKAELISAAHKAIENVSTIDALKAAIQNFDGLSIQKTASNLVFAEGNPSASIMVVNDIPQDAEDLNGQPFAGNARKILDYALNAIGLNSDINAEQQHIYMSSLLNWRPPGNRTPQAAEIAVSRIFLEKHIALSEPKIVVLMGNTACKTMLECRTNINKLRGNWQTLKYDSNAEKSDNYFILPSFHPSSLIGSAKNKKLFWQDMLTLKVKLKSLK